MNAKISRIKWTRTFGNLSYILGAAFLIASLAFNAFPAGPAFAKDNNNGGGSAGAIWTTSGSCGSPQNVNHYEAGNVVYINGSGFDAGGHDWRIKGQPGGASGDPGENVASGTVTVDASGAFCFAAYTVKDDDWGEYSVKVGNKGDNYAVTGSSVSPTNTPVDPTATPTDNPGDPTATPTDDPGEPTATPTDEATATPTDNPGEPTATPTDQATAIPTDNPGEPTATPTDEATATATGDPGQPTATATATPHPTQKPLSLNLSSFCGPDSGELNWWKIENQDSSDATILWKVMPLSTPSETYFLPGDSTYKFSTAKNSDAEELYVYDSLDELVGTAPAATGCQQDKATPTAVPAHPNPASSTSQDVLIPVTGAALSTGSRMPTIFFNLGVGFLGLGLVLNGVARQRRTWDL